MDIDLWKAYADVRQNGTVDERLPKVDFNDPRKQTVLPDAFREKRKHLKLRE